MANKLTPEELAKLEEESLLRASNRIFAGMNRKAEQRTETVKQPGDSGYTPHRWQSSVGSPHSWVRRR
jgi:hypothetical protein